MLLLPHLRLLRNRLIFAAIVTFVGVVIEFMAISASDLSFGVLWHQACNRPVELSDVRIVIEFALDFIIIGGMLGYMSGGGGNTQSYAQPAALRFMLTRPQSRLNLVFAPFLISATAIALLPGLVWILLVGWLYLVHAPSLDHLVAVFETIPAASQLGPHPTFWTLIAAAHLGRFYLAGISVGLCVYVFLSSSCWLTQSRFTSLKILGVFSSVFALLLFFLRRIAWMRSLLFVPIDHAGFTYLPSQAAIALHFAFAAVWFYGTLRVARDLQL